MTQEIIEMAQECGLIGMRPHLDGIYSEALVAFAKLVAEKALAEHAMRETQRLGQEIEQKPVQFKCTVIDDVHPNGIPLEQWTPPPQRIEQSPVADDIASILACRDMLDAQPVPPRTWIGLEGAEAGWFCHTDFLNARKYTKKQREYICNQLLSEAQSWDIDQYIRMMHDSTKRKENT